MPNVKSTDKAWLAGILDGEGSIILNLMPSRPRWHVCRVQFTNTDMGILNEIKRILNKWLIFYYFSLHPPSYASRKPCFVIQVHRQLECQFLLEQVLPYLKSVKYQKALLFIDYIKQTRVRKDKRLSNRKKKLGQLGFPLEV